MTSETPTARQKRVWDKNAPSYDRQIAFFEKVWFGGGREWLSKRVHGRVLEVAIGTGLNPPHYPSGTIDRNFAPASPALVRSPRKWRAGEPKSGPGPR